ncbi:MAG: helix-turn-helix domain-containing protein [Candidatus Dormibacteria bacterium]
MSVVVDAAEMSEAMAMRGLLQKDLAQIAGVSETAVSLMMHGRHIRASTFGRITRALATAPVIELVGAERLIRTDPRTSTAAPGPAARVSGDK